MVRSALAAAMMLALASPVQAGEWQYDPGSDLIYYGTVPVARWNERPTVRPAPRHYPRQARVPRCPNALCGYPIPIYKARRPSPATWNLGAPPSSHVEWCAERYRSYDAGTDTYQPHRGPRRVCRSPFG